VITTLANFDPEFKSYRRIYHCFLYSCPLQEMNGQSSSTVKGNNSKKKINNVIYIIFITPPPQKKQRNLRVLVFIFSHFRKKKRFHIFWSWVTSKTHNCDDEGDTFLRNVVNQLPNHRALTTQKVWFLDMKTGLQLTHTSRAVSFTAGNAPSLPHDLLHWKPVAVFLSHKRE